MKARAITSIVLASILIIAVMAVSASMTFTSERPSTIGETTTWTFPYVGTQSMKIIDLTGDDQRDVFLQNSQNITVLNREGQPVYTRDFATPIATSMGDVNGDKSEDVVAVTYGGQVTAISNGQELWNATAAELAEPTRIAVIRFESGTQVVIGDSEGQLVSLSKDGKQLWKASVGGGSTEGIRALDDAINGKETILTVANHDGAIAAFNAGGEQLWSQNYGGELRRLRSYDLNGDRKSEVLVGGEIGYVNIYDAASGNVITQIMLGQVITEIRDAEINQEPSSTEFIAGGKKGGVWGISSEGKILWSAGAFEKMTEIAALDLDEDGKAEVLAGDDAGKIYIYDGLRGARIQTLDYSSGIARIDVGRLVEGNTVVIADGSTVRAIRLQKKSAPFFYTPLVAGLIISFVIAAAAWFLTSLPEKPTMQVAIKNQTPEGLEMRKHMLHESIADVERLKQRGEMTPEAYLARIRELREEMAETESLLLQNNIRFKPETFQCPKCGGPLPLGIDRCDYCGMTVIV